MSDGDGNPRGFFDNSGNWTVAGPYANPPTTSWGRITSTGILQSGRTGTGSQPAAEFFNGNGNVGSIYTSGSSTAFNTSSDYRLKENVQNMTGALEKVSQLRPVTYDWIADKSAGQGFIAHELQAVIPDCVTGVKDAVDADGKPIYQGIDTSFLVATLTAAIQELNTLVTQQAAQIAALQSKLGA